MIYLLVNIAKRQEILANALCIYWTYPIDVVQKKCLGQMVRDMGGMKRKRIKKKFEGGGKIERVFFSFSPFFSPFKNFHFF